MALKKLLWRKYLFVDRTEAETEQAYWNEKRKKHLASEHSAGIVNGLAVTATSPPSLSVRVAGGRAVDSNGNDPEVESEQEVDLSALVPPSGEATAYIALRFTETEVEPYFVDEIGGYQNKYLHDGAHLEVLAAPPSAPAVELARVLLGAGAAEVADAADPQDPGENEIDLTHREYTGKEVLCLEDLADVTADEAAAFGNMDSPSAANPVATLADVEAGVSPVAAEVAEARGSQPSLDARIDVALGDDGALKAHAATHKGDGSDAVAVATPSVAGLMSATDKGKLDMVEPGAVAAGEAGDAHATVTAGNPHDLDAADVGAAPSTHVGAGGAEHAAVTGSAAGFMAAADKAALDGHVGAGGAAHALAVAGGAAGFMSGADKSKLDGVSGSASTWVVLDPAAGSIETQMAGMLPGRKYWLKPGAYVLGATLTIGQPGVWLAGTREAYVNPAANAEIRVTGRGCRLSGFSFNNKTTSTESRCVHVTGEHSSVEEVWFEGDATAAGRRTAVRLEAQHCSVRGCRFFVRKTTPGSTQPLVRTYPYCTVEGNCFLTDIAGDWDTNAIMVGAGTSGMAECRVLYNEFEIHLPASRYATVIAGDGPSGHFAGWIVGNRIFVNVSGNYVTGISARGDFVVDKNRVLGCGKYGIYSSGVGDGMQITNNRVAGTSGDYAETGIRLYKTTSGAVSCEVTVAGNFVRYCETGVLIHYGSPDLPKCVNVLGNSIRDTSADAIRVAGNSPFFVDHVNVDGNCVDGFAAGIVIQDCRRASCAQNQLTGGTGIGIDLGGGAGSYDVKVVACDVETTGPYCYRVGHERNTLLNCSGRGASMAIYYVFGSHNSVIGCETDYAAADVLRVEGDRHNVHDNDFGYAVDSGHYSVILTTTSGLVFVHGNRLYAVVNLIMSNIIYANVVNDAYKAGGF